MSHREHPPLSTSACDTSTELTVVVPVLNEVAVLPRLFNTLSLQRQLTLELVLSDGNSLDGSLELAHRLAATVPYPVRILEGPAGRGRQLNAGAAASCSQLILFLHADSEFPDPLALRRGVDLLTEFAAAGRPAAGHFALRFMRSSRERSLAYHYYECKARLDRPECCHGDQGLMLERVLLRQVGPFAEEMPAAETLLVERLRSSATLVLLPAEIASSARRFECEGMARRQTLNAIIMALLAVGRSQWLSTLPGGYRSQDRAKRLLLGPVLESLRLRISGLPLRQRWQFWLAVGGYVRNNSWQVALFLDAWRSFRRGKPPGQGPLSCLCIHDRWLAPIICSQPVAWIVTLLVRSWFALAWLCFRRELPPVSGVHGWQEQGDGRNG